MKTGMALGITLALVASSVLAQQPPGKGKPKDTLASLSCASSQIARFNGSAWVCSDDQSGPGNGWKVVDANGVPVLSPASLIDVAEARGFITANISGQDEWFYLVVYTLGIETNTLYFESSDCTGTPYLRNERYFGDGGGGWGTDQREHGFAVSPDPSNPGLKLFYSASQPTLVQVTISSALSTSFGESGSEVYCEPAQSPVTFSGYSVQGRIDLPGWTFPFRMVLQ